MIDILILFYSCHPGNQNRVYVCVCFLFPLTRARIEEFFSSLLHTTNCVAAQFFFFFFVCVDVVLEDNVSREKVRQVSFCETLNDRQPRTDASLSSRRGDHAISPNGSRAMSRERDEPNETDRQIYTRTRTKVLY